MTEGTDPDPHLGRTLGGQYRIDALLGSGGMGRVYRGVQLSVMRPVAIKLIAGESPHPAEWLQRFRREAEATARLSHPNSVRLFDFGVTESRELYMVMELLEGIDLARHLQEHGPMQLPAALSVIRQALYALAEAHALGIVHRDVKPENVFLARVPGGDVVAKVMDFGIAGLERPRSSGKLTSTGVVIGTPAYMSPEQAQGRPVGAKSDLYSLGAVLFELLTGRMVFESSTIVSLLVLHVTQRPQSLAEVGVQVPQQDAVQALLDGLLAKEPSDRPTAREALDWVESLLAEQAPRRTGRGALARANFPDTPPYVPKAYRPRAVLTVLVSGLALSAVAAVVLRWAPPAARAIRTELSAATAAPPPPQRCVTIEAVPKSASVWVDGAELGKTPYEYCFHEAADLSVMQRGYERQLVRLTSNSPAKVAVALVPEVKDQPRPVKPPEPAPAPAKPPPAAAERPAPPPLPPLAAAAEHEIVPPPFAHHPPVIPDPEPEPEPERGHEPEHEPEYGQMTVREAEEEQQRASGNRGLKILGRAMLRAVGKLVIPYPDRERRQVLAHQPLAFHSYRDARRAYDEGMIDRTGFEEAIWQLRQRRRHDVQAERNAYARGELSQAEFDARVDRIWDEFWGR